MSKKWKIFFKILYYLFAFAVGLFLILAVPSAKKDELSFRYLNDFVENEEFVKAVDMLSYAYNATEISNEKLDKNAGLIIFEELSTLDQTVEEVTTTIMDNSYLCIIYNLEKLSFYGNDENKTILKINGNPVEILTHDYNGDGTNDSVPSLINSTYICFSVHQTEYEKFDSVELLDKDGNVYLIKENINLTFESDFFTISKGFVEKYTAALVDKVFDKNEDTALRTEFDTIHTLNQNYQLIDSYGTSTKIYEDASKESFIFVLTFFIWALVLGDCLVGKRYIWNLLKKIFGKIKPKKAKSNEAIGTNFFSMVTFKANIFDEFTKDVILSYESLIDKQYNFKVIIGKNSEYLVKQRVHSGKYKLINVECTDCEVLNLSDEIEVKGYTMLIEFNIQNKK